MNSVYSLGCSWIHDPPASVTRAAGFIGHCLQTQREIQLFNIMPILKGLQYKTTQISPHLLGYWWFIRLLSLGFKLRRNSSILLHLPVPLSEMLWIKTHWFCIFIRRKGSTVLGGAGDTESPWSELWCNLGHISLGVLMTARHSESTPPTLSSPLPSIPSHLPVFDSQFKKIAFCLLSQ